MVPHLFYCEDLLKLSRMGSLRKAGIFALLVHTCFRSMSEPDEHAFAESQGRANVPLVKSPNTLAFIAAPALELQLRCSWNNTADRAAELGDSFAGTTTLHGGRKNYVIHRCWEYLNFSDARFNFVSVRTIRCRLRSGQSVELAGRSVLQSAPSGGFPRA